jgi:hypothetical protein
MELDDDDTLAGRYRLCGIGFALSGIALGLLSLSSGLSTVLFLTGQSSLRLQIFQHPLWEWGVRAPITLGSFVGSYLLWGRWRATSWQRRAGLLVLMNGIDTLLWAKEVIARQSVLLPGQQPPASHHEWLLHLFVIGIGWAELILFAGLAADVSGQLGNEESQNSGGVARTFSFVGVLLWAMMALTQTNWERWPLVHFRSAEWAIMMIGTEFLIALASFQVTVLCMSTSRQCRRYVRELNHDDGHELLASRSDDPDWGQDRDRW